MWCQTANYVMFSENDPITKANCVGASCYKMVGHIRVVFYSIYIPFGGGGSSFLNEEGPMTGLENDWCITELYLNFKVTATTGNIIFKPTPPQFESDSQPLRLEHDSLTPTPPNLNIAQPPPPPKLCHFTDPPPPLSLKMILTLNSRLEYITHNSSLQLEHD